MSALSDRYEVLGLLASGGMASVLYGRLKGPAGFQREVAIKRLHPHFAREPEFLQMFIDEAHICARLSHANIISAFDVIETPPDLCLVMEYVAGAGLDVLLQASRARRAEVPLRIASAVMTNALHGLHAAHEARDDHGESLGIVHRDVSPSNVLVGQDGIARVLDFGIAGAVSKLRTTPGGELKGKFAYMAPELLRGERIDRRLDVYAASVVLWEVLAGRPLFGGQPSATVVRQVLAGEIPTPSSIRSDLPPALDQVVMRGLANEPSERFASTRELAGALERECGVASQHEVSEWIHQLVGELLNRRTQELRRLQRERPRDPTTQVSEREDATLHVPLRAESTAAPSIRPPSSSLRRWPLIATLLLLLLGVGTFLVVRAPAPPALAPAPAVAAAKPSPEPPVGPVLAAPVLASPIVHHEDAAAPVQGEVEPAHKRRARPLRAKAAEDTCTDAVQLELIGGVMVKTYKPECLK